MEKDFAKLKEHFAKYVYGVNKEPIMHLLIDYIAPTVPHIRFIWNFWIHRRQW